MGNYQLENRLKHDLRDGRQLIGLWSMMNSVTASEAIGYSGFDWLLIDTEHAPLELQDVVVQMLAMGRGTATPIVRLASNDPVLVKRYLDAGVHNLMIPSIRSPEEARQAVAATRYPPKGVRGLAVMHRSSLFVRVPDYVDVIEDQICLILQIETREAMGCLSEITAVDGVDAVFIGPADLAASFGLAGKPTHPEVQSAIREALRECRRIGVPVGIVAPTEELAEVYLREGVALLSVGSDLSLLCRAADSLADTFRMLRDD